jgi:hypothetical protein
VASYAHVTSDNMGTCIALRMLPIRKRAPGHPAQTPTQSRPVPAEDGIQRTTEAGQRKIRDSETDKLILISIKAKVIMVGLSQSTLEAFRGNRWTSLDSESGNRRHSFRDLTCRFIGYAARHRLWTNGGDT